ncbi:MAG: DUF4249 domain-containing protein [Cyclobacteriaceae bacterium]
MEKIKRFWFVVMIVILGGCLEPISPEKINTEELLVIEAMITDQPTIQTVLLSKTVPLSRSEAFNGEKGAEVWVEDGSGNQTHFLETKDGKYQTVAPFAAQLGTTYQLHVITRDGKEYESAVSTMVPTSPIDSVYAEFELLPDPPFDVYNGNFNFFVDSRTNINQNKYFRWIWNSTHQVNVPNPSRWLWTGGNTYIIRERGSENDHLQVERCWSSDTTKQLHLKELLPGESQVIKQRLNKFHSLDDPRMKVRYSIEVKQYALSEESYRFWSLISESNAGQGFLFDTQVGTIVGNIRSVSDNSQTVLGFFEVVQEQSVREFFEPRDFADEGYLIADPYIVDCSDEEPIITNVDQIGEFMEENGEDYTLCFFITTPPGAGFHLKKCSECTLYADSNKEPDFW